MYQANNHKGDGLAILMSDKLDFKTKDTTRDDIIITMIINDSTIIPSW